MSSAQYAKYQVKRFSKAIEDLNGHGWHKSECFTAGNLPVAYFNQSVK